MDGDEGNGMIAFRDGYQPEGSKYLQLSKGQIKKLVEKVMEAGAQFTEGSYHGGLSPTQIEMIISHILYTQDKSSLTITIDKDLDGYHLGLKIDAVEK